MPRCGSAPRRRCAWRRASDWLLDIALDHLSLGRAHLLAVQRGAAGDLAEAASHLQQAVDGLRRAGQQDVPPPRPPRPRRPPHPHPRLRRRPPRPRRSPHPRHPLRLPPPRGRRPPRPRPPLPRRGRPRRRPRAPRHRPPHHRRHRLPPPRRRAGRARGRGRGDGQDRPAAGTIASTTPAETRAHARQPTAAQPVDVGIVVALREELRELLDASAGRPRRHAPPTAWTPTSSTRGGYRCVVTSSARWARRRRPVMTERLIVQLGPESVVVASASRAASTSDLRVGDVYVPAQAEQYIQDAKASPAAGAVLIGRARPPTAPTTALHTSRRLRVRPSRRVQALARGGRSDLAELLPDAAVRERLVREDLVRARASSSSRTATWRPGRWWAPRRVLRVDPGPRPQRQGGGDGVGRRPARRADPERAEAGARDPRDLGLRRRTARRSSTRSAAARCASTRCATPCGSCGRCSTRSAPAQPSLSRSSSNEPGDRLSSHASGLHRAAAGDGPGAVRPRERARVAGRVLGGGRPRGVRSWPSAAWGRARW